MSRLKISCWALSLFPSMNEVYLTEKSQHLLIFCIKYASHCAGVNLSSHLGANFQRTPSKITWGPLTKHAIIFWEWYMWTIWCFRTHPINIEFQFSLRILACCLKMLIKIQLKMKKTNMTFCRMVNIVVYSSKK